MSQKMTRATGSSHTDPLVIISLSDARDLIQQHKEATQRFGVAFNNAVERAVKIMDEVLSIAEKWAEPLATASFEVNWDAVDERMRAEGFSPGK